MQLFPYFLRRGILDHLLALELIAAPALHHEVVEHCGIPPCLHLALDGVLLVPLAPLERQLERLLATGEEWVLHQIVEGVDEAVLDWIVDSRLEPYCVLVEQVIWIVGRRRDILIHRPSDVLVHLLLTRSTAPLHALRTVAPLGSYSVIETRMNDRWRHLTIYLILRAEGPRLEIAHPRTGSPDRVHHRPLYLALASVPCNGCSLRLPLRRLL